jgi:hypothetical protein
LSSSARHLARRAQDRLGQRVEPGWPAGGFLGDGAKVVVRDSEFAAQLHMMRIFIGRAGQVADLQDSHLAQARIEAALEANEGRERAEGAGTIGAVHERAHQVDVAYQQVLVFRRQIRFVEIW